MLFLSWLFLRTSNLLSMAVQRCCFSILEENLLWLTTKRDSRLSKLISLLAAKMSIHISATSSLAWICRHFTFSPGHLWVFID